MQLKWKKLAVVAALTAAAVCAAMSFARADTELITYTKEVRTGDTLWDIVSSIATENENVQELTWQVMQDNHIKDPGNLQPGQVIIIRVKKARDL